MTVDWIRGVNLGGWLVLERFITPYLFAVTTCHLEGNFCSYPGQFSLGPNVEPCDLYHCKPVQIDSVAGHADYPVDEWTLMQQFSDPDIAKKYLNLHYDNFVTEADIQKLQAAGVTHVRVPMGHWILGDVSDEEPYVYNEQAWMYFVRLVAWCRSYDIQVWPDLHTAPGSQNGFDNSGHLLGGEPTCSHWGDNSTNVERTLDILLKLAQKIKDYGLTDVVTGLGILNEPFEDCNIEVVKRYNQAALEGVRVILGDDFHIYQGDLFHSQLWNDGKWWATETNTYLDSHYYHVFAEEPRALSPQQHIAYVCRKNYRDTIGCCYENGDPTKAPVKGISRIIGEWSASYDTLPVAMLDAVMESIRINGTALHLDREFPKERQQFMQHFVQAQMVAYEAADAGVSSGWFYWTLKMEGGAFAEWDFLRGLNQGWIEMPKPTETAQSLYGTCEEILKKTTNDMSIVHEYPDPSTLPEHNWQGVDISDDLVLSVKPDGSEDTVVPPSTTTATQQHHHYWFTMLVLCFFAYAVHHVFIRGGRQVDVPVFGRRANYQPVSSAGESLNLTV